MKRGMRFAGIAALIYVILILFLILPENGLLRNPETGSFLISIYGWNNYNNDASL